MMCPLKHRSSQQGFTLTELMVAIAVLAIGIGLSIPSFQDLIASQRVRAAADALATSVMYARSEAIKRNAAMEITAVDDDWSNGWSVKVKGNTSVLRSEALSGVLVTGLDEETLEIGRAGRLSDTLTLTLCDSGNRAMSRVVTISFSGMTRVNVGERCGS